MGMDDETELTVEHLTFANLYLLFIIYIYIVAAFALTLNITYIGFRSSLFTRLIHTER